MASKELNKAEYPLVIEKIIQRIGIPFWKSIVVFSLLIFSMSFLVPFALGLLGKVDEFNLYHIFMWSWPGLISVITTIYFSKRLRDKTVCCISALLPFIKEGRQSEVLTQMKNSFSKKKALLLPLIGSFIFAVPFQIYYLAINPVEPIWITLHQISPVNAKILGLWAAISTWIGCFFILSLGYIAINVAYIIYKNNDFLVNLSIENIDSGILRPMGALAGYLASCFLLGTIINLGLFFIAPVVWWSILEVSLFSISVLLLFFVPIYDLHLLMVKKKEEAIKELKAKWWTAVRKPSLKETRITGSIVKRIEQIPTWPFETKRLLEIAGYVIVPFLVWLISYLTR